MIDNFKEDFFWMMREGKGYFPWVAEDSYKLTKHLCWHRRKNCMMCHDGITSRELIRTITEENVCENPLFDLFMKALIRAELRLISRFVPQRSHEERLTGNIVSEIDNALFLIRSIFRETAIKLYSTEKEIDFFYYDLSQGGKVEKNTGADLGLILAVDLPDFPFAVKSLILQAKKISSVSAKIERSQHEILMKHGEKECAYLFYDMDLGRRCSPLVVPVGQHYLKIGIKKCQEENNGSFSLPFSEVRSDGFPLSLFLSSLLLSGDSFGGSHATFDSAFNMFLSLSREVPDRQRSALSGFNGRLAILSLGRPIKFSTPHNEGLRLEI